MHPTCTRIVCILSCLLFAVQATELCASSPQIPPQSLTQKVSNISGITCPASTKFFPQLINHNTTYNDTNATFLQQYEIVDKYYKPGGPILFVQSDEAPMACVDFMSVTEWAKDLDALVMILEHRYFGPSCPYGLNYSLKATWDPKLMAPLTLDNVLMDGVNFLNWVKNSAYPTAKDSQVIVTGGSYGGFLAAAYRQNCPQHIFGSIASSPVTKGLTSDPNDPLTLARGSWANMVYNDYSPQAAAKIQSSIAYLRAQLESGNFTGLQERLLLCSPLNSTSQIDSVLNTVYTAFGELAQFNAWAAKYPFYQIISTTLAEDDPLIIIEEAINLVLPVSLPNSNGKCVYPDPQYKNVDPFQYIRCTYYPYAGWFSSGETIWGPNLPDYKLKNLNDPYCQASFGFDAVNGGLAYQQELGLDQQSLENSTRLFVSMGMFDAISTQGPDSWNPGPSRDDSRVFFINQAAHTADMNAGQPTDSEALNLARRYELNSIKGWLGITD